MQLKELTNKEFSEFTNSFDLKSIYQTFEYGLIMNKQEYESILLGLYDNDILKAATLILIRIESGFKYAYAPRGFLLNYENFYLLKDFTNHIKEYLNKKGVMGIKINPMVIRNIYDFNNQALEKNHKYDLIYEAMIHNHYYHLGYNNFFEALNPRFEAILDINKPIEELFKNVKKSFKTKIRSAIKSGIRVYKGNIEDLDKLYSIIKDKYKKDLSYFKDCYEYFNKSNMVDLYYTKLDTKVYLSHIQNKLEYYEQQSNKLNNLIIKNPTKNNKKTINKKINIDKYLNKYQNELIKATNYLRNYPEGIITSCILVVKQNDQVTVLLDGFDKTYKFLNSKHLLIWQLIDIYSKLGYKVLNLGGLSNNIVDHEKYVGLNEFKLNFGAKMYEYAGDFELITNKRNYNLYRNYVPLKNLIKSKLNK